MKKILLSLTAFTFLFFLGGSGVVFGQTSCADQYPNGPAKKISDCEAAKKSIQNLLDKQKNAPVETQDAPVGQTLFASDGYKLKPLCAEWTEKVTNLKNTENDDRDSCNDTCLDDSNNSECKRTCLEDTTRIRNLSKDSNIDPTSFSGGFVCTELLEGIPLEIVKGNGSSCYPLTGGHWVISGKTKEGKVAITLEGKSKFCYAVLSSTGLGSITSYVGMIYRYAAWIIGILGVLGIIIAGIRISIGSAISSEVAAGKQMITKIIGGVILFFLIGAILRTLNPNFFTSGTAPTSAPQKAPIQGTNGAT